MIDQKGVPTLTPRPAKQRRAGTVALEAALKRRMQERSLLGIVARTAHWTGWWRHLGPASGSDPKLSDQLVRYALMTFTYGTNLGPAQAARHIRGVSAHELGATFRRHATIAKLNRAIADVVDAFMELDLVKAWGDGSSVAVDGTQIDTLIENLLAEQHIRYGGYGGIAYHHIADTYIALFSRFIPCGAWEAIYIIEGLLQNESNVKPGTIHADTQGQSFPVFGLAYLLGFDLLPRIRNWKELIFYRSSAEVRYEHIDSIFGDPGRNVIDWQLIETHWRDLMQVALSIREGKLSSVLLLRRLGTNSRKNNIYKAFRELGRAVRTIALLRFISDPQLREQVTAAINKVEAFNGYSAWLRFGGEVIERNDPAEQEKILKFNSLLANCVIFHITLDMMDVIRDLQREGHTISIQDLAPRTSPSRSNVSASTPLTSCTSPQTRSTPACNSTPTTTSNNGSGRPDPLPVRERPPTPPCDLREHGLCSPIGVNDAPALGIAVVDMYATRRAEGGGEREGPYPSREVAFDDVVDVIDTGEHSGAGGRPRGAFVDVVDT